MSMKIINVADIEGFRLGNAENKDKGTGCTVIICEEGAVGGVDVRGGGPATRETDLLRSENTVNSVNAVVLSGGSAFGLEAASGVMRELAVRSIGFDVGTGITVPIVCGASLYDLAVGDPTAFPDVNMGMVAVRNAFEGLFQHGNHGAGTGATVGKYMGHDRAMKTGLGTFACGDGFIEVGAISAVNAIGDVYNGAGHIIAGLRSEDGETIYGTIKTLKGMVHDNAGLVDDSTSFINRSEIEEALASSEKTLQEENAPEEPEAEDFIQEEIETPEQEEMIQGEPEAPEAEEIVPEEEPACEEPGSEETVQEGYVSEEPYYEEPVTPEQSEVFSEEQETSEEYFQEEPPYEEAGSEEPSQEEFVSDDPFSEEPEGSFPEGSESCGSEETIQEESASEEQYEETEGSEQEVSIQEEPVYEEPEQEESAQEEFVSEAPYEETEAPEEEDQYPETSLIDELFGEEDFSEPEEESNEETVPVEVEGDQGDEEPAEEAAEEEAEEETEEEPPVELTREEMGYTIAFNTTISCLITNAALTKSQANKLASILHDAYARAIKPVHGTLDGDTVFVLATGRQQINFDAFAALATDVMQYAIIDAATSARSAYGLPAAADMKKPE